MNQKCLKNQIAYYHLPGMFEFYEFYKVFLPLYRDHREYFYDWCEIGSIYGAPSGALWGGGRVGVGDVDARCVLDLLTEHGISARLTFSNSLLREEHLKDVRCNALCELFENGNGECAGECAIEDSQAQTNGVIVHSELLLNYLKKNYPNLYLVSSTTKVLTDFSDCRKEVEREEFRYVVPDFRLNRSTEEWQTLTQVQKDKIEFLCNECCDIHCKARKACYENVSRKILGENCEDHQCQAPEGNQGYLFSKAMESSAFIGMNEIQNTYLPMGYSNFKIEGRGLGSALLLEFILYYMTKPEYQLKVREEMYLDSMLDLF